MLRTTVRIGRIAALGVLLTLATAAALRAEDDFEKRGYAAADGKTLPYRLLKPLRYDAKQRYPLVVFLHGAGERGSDNERQLAHCVRDFAKPEVREQHPCFVVAPQCGGAYRWCEVDWGDPKPHQTPKEPSVPMGQLIALLPELAKEFSIDPARLYVTGLSMGGFGTWDLITRFPERFAAAAPICGGADDSAAPSLARLPIWVFHGGADPVVHTGRSQSMVAALKQAGSTVVTYTEYPGVGHDSWDKAFAEPGFFAWMFSQRRAGAPTR